MRVVRKYVMLQTSTKDAYDLNIIVIISTRITNDK